MSCSVAVMTFNNRMIISSGNTTAFGGVGPMIFVRHENGLLIRPWLLLYQTQDANGQGAIYKLILDYQHGDYPPAVC